MFDLIVAPEDVRSAFESTFGRKKREALHRPELAGKATWGDLLSINFEMIKHNLGLIERLETAKGRTLSSLELVEIRCAIDALIRRASTRPTQYAAPLYLSAGVIRQALKWQAGAGKISLLMEHACPLTVFVSGTKLLSDPAKYLPLLRHAVLTPVCAILRDEDPKDRTGHPELQNGELQGGVVQRPFLRYAEAGIQIYSVADFRPIDPLLFSWDHHIEAMRAFAAYRSGMEFAEGVMD